MGLCKITTCTAHLYLCVCVRERDRDSFVKTTKMAKCGLESQVCQTTKLVGMTWEITFRKLQLMPNVTWQSHARTPIQKWWFWLCWIKKWRQWVRRQRWLLNECMKFEQIWRLRHFDCMRDEFGGIIHMFLEKVVVLPRGVCLWSQ